MKLDEQQTDDRSTLKIWLPRTLHRQVRMAAVGRGETLRSYVAETLAKELEREKRK